MNMALDEREMTQSTNGEIATLLHLAVQNTQSRETVGAALGKLLSQVCQFQVHKPFFGRESVSLKVDSNSVFQHLDDAQAVSRLLFGRDAVEPECLDQWKNSEEFLAGVSSESTLYRAKLTSLYSCKRDQEDRICVQTEALCYIGTHEAIPLVAAALAQSLYFIKTGRDLFCGQFIGVAGGSSDYERSGEKTALVFGEGQGLSMNRPGSFWG
jgi:hypothetical protein